MRNFIEEVKSGKVLISDGAWGTFLYEKGLSSDECPELWNLTHRDKVLEIAESYIEAGSDMILTNSFGASPYKLKRYGLDDRTYEINKTAAEISREAAGDDHFVLGSIGPTGAILMMGDISEEELLNGFAIQAKALAEGGADAICVETMSDIAEAVSAVKAAKSVCDLPVVCTFTFEKTVNNDYRTMMGVTPAQMAVELKNAGASVIGSNCGNGFDQMIEIVKEIRSVEKELPVLVHANAGKPVFQEGKTVYLETPDSMAHKLNLLIESGANIIGGCCGTTPRHIEAFVNKIKK
jgi:5-methyltetrahydrofolate--homocysteine methyltransferase